MAKAVFFFITDVGLRKHREQRGLGNHLVYAVNYEYFTTFFLVYFT